MTSTVERDPDDRLIYDASRGSIDAQLRLADLNFAAWTSGVVDQLVALTGAEVWARLAASSGRADAVTLLTEIFTARATFDGLRGLMDSAGWYEAEAQRRRVSDGLISREVGTTPTISVLAGQPNLTPDYDASLAAAARGDPAALGVLFDDAVQRLVAGACEPIEALTVIEIYARLSAARGDPGSLQRLAGVLGSRANHELGQGNKLLAANALAEGITLISLLADGGDDAMAAMLKSMVQHTETPGVAIAICARASILAHVLPHGCC